MRLQSQGWYPNVNLSYQFQKSHNHRLFVVPEKFDLTKLFK